MTVVTRFAPSPTGVLHIGSARTALFNWLFSRHHGGTFLLRIEDTDRVRSTPESEAAILEGLKWLGLDWDGEPVFQFARASRHQEIAHALLVKGSAYRCYTSPEELERMREEARAAGRPPHYDGRWRDKPETEAPVGVPFAVRLKAPREGVTALKDQVQGDITVQNAQLDDMVLLRADGTPTYMLSVVVDDYDMGITHVIRGDDHLTNTFRQLQIYGAMGWEPPLFSHIPMIHGPDGGKLSKRHGAVGVGAYQEMGFLPEAMRNYLLRLGWGHGDVEIISTDEAIALFSCEGIGQSPARFDLAKLTNLNAHYLREADDDRLLCLLKAVFESEDQLLTDVALARIRSGLPGLKQRAKTLLELQEGASIYLQESAPLLTPEGEAVLRKPNTRAALQAFEALLQDRTEPLSADALEVLAREEVLRMGIKLGELAQPLRVALTGRTVSPPIFEVADILGTVVTRRRLQAAIHLCQTLEGEPV